jgi:hypothetical protein
MHDIKQKRHMGSGRPAFVDPDHFPTMRAPPKLLDSCAHTVRTPPLLLFFKHLNKCEFLKYFPKT